MPRASVTTKIASISFKVTTSSILTSQALIDYQDHAQPRAPKRPARRLGLPPHERLSLVRPPRRARLPRGRRAVERRRPWALRGRARRATPRAADRGGRTPRQPGGPEKLHRACARGGRARPRPRTVHRVPGARDRGPRRAPREPRLAPVEEAPSDARPSLRRQ